MCGSGGLPVEVVVYVWKLCCYVWKWWFMCGSGVVMYGRGGSGGLHVEVVVYVWKLCCYV